MKTKDREKVKNRSHVVCAGNRKRIKASREAIGAMKYKAQ